VFTTQLALQSYLDVVYLRTSYITLTSCNFSAMTHNLFIEQLAEKITTSGLTMPAVLLLEAHKPLAFLVSQMLLVAQPSLNLFISPTFTQNLTNLLAEDEQLEQLITTLERMDK